MSEPSPRATATRSPALHAERPIAVRVLLFSVLRERIGCDLLSVSLPVGATGRDLLDWVAAEHAAFGPFRSVVRLAVNEQYVGLDEPLADGDEVAFITPVSGG